mmetsp:Transcript_50019/g.113548  ORF Transcript_50019/g.113548 Transcript_50019/m.113548 type:complete len:366 (-) Transcript_50019:105-1202(-)
MISMAAWIERTVARSNTLFSAVRQLAAPHASPNAKARTTTGTPESTLEEVSPGRSHAWKVPPATASPAPTGLSTGPGSGGMASAHLFPVPQSYTPPGKGPSVQHTAARALPPPALAASLQAAAATLAGSQATSLSEPAGGASPASARSSRPLSLSSAGQPWAATASAVASKPVTLSITTLVASEAAARTTAPYASPGTPGGMEPMRSTPGACPAVDSSSALSSVSYSPGKMPPEGSTISVASPLSAETSVVQMRVGAAVRTHIPSSAPGALARSAAASWSPSLPVPMNCTNSGNASLASSAAACTAAAAAAPSCCVASQAPWPFPPTPVELTEARFTLPTCSRPGSSTRRCNAAFSPTTIGDDDM